MSECADARNSGKRPFGLSSMETAGLWAAVTYGIGFVVVQYAMYRVGYPLILGFRMKYFAAGLLWLVMAGSYFAEAYVRRSTPDAPSEQERVTHRLVRGVTCAASLVGTVVWGLVVLRQSWLGHGPTSWLFWRVPVACAILVVVPWLVAFTRIGSMTGQVLRATEHDRCLLGITAAVLSPLLFSVLVYPAIPAGIGGGCPAPVTIRLSPSSALPAEVTDLIGLQVSNGRPADTVPLRCGLLDRSDLGYLVVVDLGPTSQSPFHLHLADMHSEHAMVLELPRASVKSVEYRHISLISALKGPEE